jgi:hypothetical protein
LATTSSGRCFFRRLVVIESLLARRAVDLHIAWIRISKAGHRADVDVEPVGEQKREEKYVSDFFDDGVALRGILQIAVD